MNSCLMLFVQCDTEEDVESILKVSKQCIFKYFKKGDLIGKIHF